MVFSGRKPADGSCGLKFLKATPGGHGTVTVDVTGAVTKPPDEYVPGFEVWLTVTVLPEVEAMVNPFPERLNPLGLVGEFTTPVVISLPVRAGDGVAPNVKVVWVVPFHTALVTLYAPVCSELGKFPAVKYGAICALV